MERRRAHALRSTSLRNHAFIYRAGSAVCTFFCVDVVSEWSKELALGASPVRVAGSNPVRIIFLFFLFLN